MSTPLLTRFEIALAVTSTDPLNERLDALHRAIQECRRDGAELADDPAVRVLTARIGEFAGLGQHGLSALISACAARAKTAARLPRLLHVMSQPIGHDADRKKAFRREAMRLLRRLAEALALEPGAYEVRFNKGGIAVSGEATLHGDELYVQISQSCMRGAEVLYRRCDGREDYCGHQNHFAPAGALCDPCQFAAQIHRELQLSGPKPGIRDADLFSGNHGAGESVF